MFSNSDFEEFAATKGRDYHLMFFLNAHYMAKNVDMNLPKLRQEYALAAQVRLLEFQMTATQHTAGH